jgi:hypothetical protein
MTSDITLSTRTKALDRLVDEYILGLSRYPIS